MSITKTLGGDRLGSGKKMKVELHNYERSTHDLGYLWRSTMSAGTLVPFLCEVALPGDTFDINLNCDVKTHPTVGPLFGSYKVQLDVFQAPIRLYNALLHNNTLGIGRLMSQVKLPQITFTVPPVGTLTIADLDVDNMNMNPSALPAYLGIRGLGLNQTLINHNRQFNAVPILAYWEIYKNYYANKQEEIGAVIHTPSAALVQTVTGIDVDTNNGLSPIPQLPTSTVLYPTPNGTINIGFSGAKPVFDQIILQTDIGDLPMDQFAISLVENVPGSNYTGTVNGALGIVQLYSWRYRIPADSQTGEPAISTFPLENIDLMRKEILSLWDTTNPLVINDANLEPYKWLYELPNGILNVLSSQEGLALKTYQSDLFNNWLKTENIDDITTSTAVDTSGGSFTIDQLVLSRKVYNMLNRINVSGGSYDDWIDAVYAHDKYQRCETPMYMGGLIKELVFQEVVSNSQSQDQPLGTLAGKGVLSNKHKGGTVVIKVDEPSYIIGIVSLTPRIDYSQGNKWDANLLTLDDLHKPALDEIGFQELITDQMAHWDSKWDTGTNEWTKRSAGKQPAWLNYMTNVNQTRGNFAIRDNEMFMTLNRRYEMDTDTTLHIKDLTTYIDPTKFNYIFAETKLDAQNFWTQISVDMIARRKMSAKIMPNL